MLVRSDARYVMAEERPGRNVCVRAAETFSAESGAMCGGKQQRKSVTYALANAKSAKQELVMCGHGHKCRRL